MDLYCVNSWSEPAKFLDLGEKTADSEAEFCHSDSKYPCLALPVTPESLRDIVGFYVRFSVKALLQCYNVGHAFWAPTSIFYRFLGAIRACVYAEAWSSTLLAALALEFSTLILVTEITFDLSGRSFA